MENSSVEISGIVKEVFDAHNRARTDPQGFASVLEEIMQYFEKDGKLLKVPGLTPVMHHEGREAYKEAVQFLKKQKPVEPEFFFNDLLQQSANDHATDIGPKGLTGHTGSDKSNYGQRIERYCKWGGAIYESIDYFKDNISGEHIVAKLIVDDGIKSRNHRNTIFNNVYKHIGIATCDHTTLGRVMVIDYGAQIISHQSYHDMMTKPKVEEVKKVGIDPDSINWDDLSKKVALEINNVRKNPKYLTKQLEKSLTCFEKFKILKVKGREIREMKEGAPAYIEAIEYCETQKSLKSLKNSENLAKSAKDHVNDIGNKGIFTQIGSDGSSPKDRMERYTAIDTYWTESIVFGGYDAKEIVEYMLVSDNIKNRGLRTNIFNEKATVMGVAVGPHAAEGSVTVVDFVSRELADGELPTMEIEAVDEIPEEVQKQIEDLGLKGKVKLVKGGNLTKEELKKKAEREYLKQNKSAAAKSFAPPPSKLNRPTTAATNPNKLEVKSGINKSSSKSKIKSTKDDNSVVTSKSSLQKPQAKGVSSKINSQDPKTTRTPVPNKTKIIDVNLSKPSLKPKESLISKISKFNPPNPISESKLEHEEEKGNYTVCKNKIDPSELEVFSDYSYDKSTDLDLPPNLKSVTCTTEIVKGVNGREMVIRKQYYLNDGRELRVKNIIPVKDKI